MSENLFITATEARSGKPAIALGVMDLLLRSVGRAGFFRPLINGDAAVKKVMDHDIHLISSHYKLQSPYSDMYAYTTSEANNLISLGQYEQLLEGIVTKYKELEKRDVHTILFFGAGEVAELAYLYLQLSRIKLVGIIDNDQHGKHFFGLKIGGVDGISRVDWDRVLLTRLDDTDQDIKSLMENGVNAERIVTL